MNISIKVTGIKEARKQMAKRAANLRSNSRVYKEIGEIASRSIKTNVESGGRPTWKPRKGQYSHPILDKTGTMRDKAELTALQNWEHQGKRHIKKILSTGYGFIHQYIGVKTDNKKVKRPFVLFQPKEIRAMYTVILKALTLKK